MNLKKVTILFLLSDSNEVVFPPLNCLPLQLVVEIDLLDCSVTGSIVSVKNLIVYDFNILKLFLLFFTMNLLPE